MTDDDTKHYDSHNAGTGWGTPPRIVKPLAEALGGFDLDPASGAEPEAYADTRYTVEDDGLSSEWFGDVWLNPPYGRTENPRWAEKCLSEWETGRVDTITALIPASTDTQWFQNHYAECDILTLIEGRVIFIGEVDDRPSFPSALASFGEFPDGYIDALHELGAVYYR